MPAPEVGAAAVLAPTIDSSGPGAGTRVPVSVAFFLMPLGSTPGVPVAVSLEPSTSSAPVTHERHRQHHDERHRDPYPEGHVHASGPAVDPVDERLRSRHLRLQLDVVYRAAMLGRTRSTLKHWTPDLGPSEEWLALKAAEGWVPEYPWDPPEVTIHGRRVWPVALIDEVSWRRGLGASSSAG